MNHNIVILVYEIPIFTRALVKNSQLIRSEKVKKFTKIALHMLDYYCK